MALRLAGEFAGNGFDLSQERGALAAESGIGGFASAQDASRNAEVALIAVRIAAALNDVLFGDAGIRSDLRPGAPC